MATSQLQIHHPHQHNVGHFSQQHHPINNFPPDDLHYQQYPNVLGSYQNHVDNQYGYFDPNQHSSSNNFNNEQASGEEMNYGNEHNSNTNNNFGMMNSHWNGNGVPRFHHGYHPYPMYQSPHFIDPMTRFHMTQNRFNSRSQNDYNQEFR